MPAITNCPRGGRTRAAVSWAGAASFWRLCWREPAEGVPSGPGDSAGSKPEAGKAGHPQQGGAAFPPPDRCSRGACAGPPGGCHSLHIWDIPEFQPGLGFPALGQGCSEGRREGVGGASDMPGGHAAPCQLAPLTGWPSCPWAFTPTENDAEAALVPGGTRGWGQGPRGPGAVCGRPPQRHHAPRGAAGSTVPLPTW